MNIKKVTFSILNATSLFFPLIYVFADPNGNSAAHIKFKTIRVENFTDEKRLAEFVGDIENIPNVGSIQKQSDGKEMLLVKGKKILEGYSLSRATAATDGTVVVSSCSGRYNQFNGDGSNEVFDKHTGNLVISLSSVWAIDPSGTPRKITSNSIDARFPIISSDGNWLAYSGRNLGKSGIPENETIYVCSMKKGIAGQAISLDLKSMGVISAVKWVGNQVIVLTTQSEEAAAFRLSWVTVTLD